MLDERKRKIIEKRMEEAIQESLTEIKNRKIDRRAIRYLVRKLEKIWAERIAQILMEMDEWMAATAWESKSIVEKRKIARGKDYSLEQFLGNVLLRVIE